MADTGAENKTDSSRETARPPSRPLDRKQSEAEERSDLLPCVEEISGTREGSDAPVADSALEPGEALEESPAEVVDTELDQLVRTPTGMKSAIEALLFSSPDPLTPRRIASVLGFTGTREVHAMLVRLQDEYDLDRRGFQILETADGYRMGTREHFSELILRLKHKKRRPTLSPAALETLAIVAYRQPIIRAEIEAIRGVESGGMLRNLIDMGLVEQVGRKEVIGRPTLYGTTEQFLHAFGLRELNDLPPIAELKRRYLETQGEIDQAPSDMSPDSTQEAASDPSAEANGPDAASEAPGPKPDPPEHPES